MLGVKNESRTYTLLVLMDLIEIRKVYEVSPLSVTGYFCHTGSIILKYLVTVADTGSSEAVTAASPTRPPQLT